MRIVVALGGNALGSTAAEQFKNAQVASDMIARLVADSHQVVVTHGNGPQVGMVNKALADMPFPECGAMTQGYIGYHLQNTLGRSLQKLGIRKDVVSLVTQVEVSLEDPAFLHPTKPIGLFMTKEEAQRQQELTGFTYMEDAGRGWRRVVPSPIPISVVEMDSIRTLMESGAVVIASGGGGIPVIRREDGFEGVAAVIDKDMSAALMADQLKADALMILTAVDAVYLNYNKPDARKLSSMTVEEAERYIAEGHFAKGSMLPKIQASLRFVKKDPGNRAAIITSLEMAGPALNKEAGTWI